MSFLRKDYWGKGKDLNLQNRFYEYDGPFGAGGAPMQGGLLEGGAGQQLQQALASGATSLLNPRLGEDLRQAQGAAAQQGPQSGEYMINPAYIENWGQVSNQQIPQGLLDIQHNRYSDPEQAMRAWWEATNTPQQIASRPPDNLNASFENWKRNQSDVMQRRQDAANPMLDYFNRRSAYDAGGALNMNSPWFKPLDVENNRHLGGPPSIFSQINRY